MTDTQLVELYAGHERGEGGAPRLRMPGEREPTAEEMFRTFAWHQGVTDPADLDRLWAAEQSASRASRRGRS